MSPPVQQRELPSTSFHLFDYVRKGNCTQGLKLYRCTQEARAGVAERTMGRESVSVAAVGSRLKASPRKQARVKRQLYRGAPFTRPAQRLSRPLHGLESSACVMFGVPWHGNPDPTHCELLSTALTLNTCLYPSDQRRLLYRGLLQSTTDLLQRKLLLEMSTTSTGSVSFEQNRKNKVSWFRL
ncbi:hypothetical protein WMY93_023179 [Mugilogobius chulae]|uniref:Uncharacterized protein n=1 Tax=Mugilogobius chulae TaxID=88201 RepID=A0AAW0N541_9GOBI